MLKKLINVNNVLFIIFSAGLTMGLLAQWLNYPGKTFQVIGTLIMAGAMVFWTYRVKGRGKEE
jgi:hypothetical protein